MSRRFLAYAVIAIVLFLQGCKRCREEDSLKYYITMRVWKSKIKAKTESKKAATKSAAPLAMEPVDELKVDPVSAGVGTKTVTTPETDEKQEEDIPECSSLEY